MSKLLDQLSEIDHELDILSSGEENRTIVEEFESSIDELAPQCDELQHALAVRAVLLEFQSEFNFDDVSEAEQSGKENSIEYFSALLASWRDNPADIRQNGSVAQFRDVAGAYQRELSANNSGKWSEWTGSLATQFLIADAQIESVKHVPDYKRPIETYRRKCEEFYALAAAVPAQIAVVGEIKKLAGELAGIKDNISFDLPPKILRFYEILDRDGHFPLSSLDSEIYDWLKEHDGLKDLSIKRRGYTSF